MNSPKAGTEAFGIGGKFNSLYFGSFLVLDDTVLKDGVVSQCTLWAYM